MWHRVLLFSVTILALSSIADGTRAWADPALFSLPNSDATFVKADNGVLYCWGQNFDGQLGDGLEASTTNPATVFQAQGTTGWSGLSAGYGHVIAIDNTGRLYSWGADDVSQLGYGPAYGYTYYTTPRLVPTPTPGMTWTAVAAGGASSLALCKNGDIYGWGPNSEGELGIGTNTSRVLVMRPVVRPAGVSRWLTVAAGELHALAISQDGLLYSWGSGIYGQLGTGGGTNAYAPVLVAFPPGVTNWTWAGCGVYDSFALAGNGELYGWGRNNLGELGIGNTNDQTVAVHIPRPAGVTTWMAIAPGPIFTLALAGDGSLYSWGFNSEGQLGLGYTNTDTGPGPTTPTPVPFPAGVSRWQAIGTTDSSGLALDDQCRLFSWGGEGNGMTGRSGASYTVLTPTLAPQLGSLCTAPISVMPSIALISPTDGEVFATSSNLVLLAAPPDPSAKSVSFYSSGWWLGTVTNQPFTMTFTNVDPGYYSFTAAVTDSNGISTMSSPAITLVNNYRYFFTRINFQPAGSDTPSGYFADAGQPFGDRGNGLSYGWNVDNSTNMIARNSPYSPDLRYDTFAYMPGDSSWQIVVPNGFYQVHFVRGDAFAEPHYFQTAVGNFWVGDTGAYDWDDDWVDVLPVTNGLITVSNVFGTNNKICFIEIQGIDAPPTLSIESPDFFAATGLLPDGTTNTARVTISRVGSTNSDLWVSYDLSGTASNNVDYYQIYEGLPDVPSTGPYNSFYFPAGKRSVVIDIVPLPNDQVQPPKSVIFTLNWNEYYNLAVNQNSNSVTLIISNINYVAQGPSPAVSLTNPQASGSYVFPTNIDLQADIGSEAGSVQRVDFLLNATNLLGSAFAPPYSFLWTNVPSGLCSLSVRAVNALQANIYSVPVNLLVIGPEPPRPARLISGPDSRTFFLINTNGMLFYWGSGVNGELNFDPSIDPTNLQSIAFPIGVTGWRDASAGSLFALAISTAGQVYSWGVNSAGQLGLGQTNDEPAPTLIPSFKDLAAWRVSAGASHALMLDSFGRLYSWGGNAYGELGNGTTNNLSAPQLVPFPAGVTAWSDVAAGNHLSLATGNDGQVYAWGLNRAGELGNNTLSNSLVPLPVLLPAAKTWKTIAAGSINAMAVSTDGQLYSWGANVYDALGYSTTNIAQPLPGLVAMPDGSNVWDSVALTLSSSLAMSQNGELYAWGNNLLGTLGVGLPSRSVVTNPAPVILPPGVTRWLAYSAGVFENLAMGDDGNLYSWGQGAIGQTNSWVAQPAIVPGIGPQILTNDLPVIDTVAVREGQFQFRIAGSSPSQSVLEVSTNLIQWIPVATNGFSDSYYSVALSNRATFYRVSRHDGM